MKRKKIYINKKKKKLPTQQGHIGKLLNSDECTYTQTHHSKNFRKCYTKKKKRTEADFSLIEKNNILRDKKKTIGNCLFFITEKDTF
jgi:hypothetical protein